jgi:hypothetical protein
MQRIKVVSHYYKILNRGGQNRLIKAGRPTASAQRSQQIVASTEADDLPTTVNPLMEAGRVSATASVNTYKRRWLA